MATAGILAGGFEAHQQFQRLQCWGGGYEQNSWMAYCELKQFGDYEHAAVYFGLEPEVAPKIEQAEVITLSGSRLQEALSISGTADWFLAHQFSLYMLGFGFDEQSGFAEMLFSKYHARPKVLIINVDPYLTGELSGPAQLIRSSPQIEKGTALSLKRFEDLHRSLCAKFSWLCTNTPSSYRSRVDGHWTFSPPPGQPPSDKGRPVLKAPPTPPAQFTIYAENARRLLNLVVVDRRCVVYTIVPSTDQSGDVAAHLAQILGGRSVQPDVSDLYTRDGSHLTPESAARWSTAFTSALQPVLDVCINR